MEWINALKIKPPKGVKVPAILCPEHSADCIDLVEYTDDGYHGQKNDWLPDDAVLEWLNAA